MPQSFRFALTPNQMMQKARDETGLDIVDKAVIEPLSVLVKSLNEEGDMFEQGAAELQKRIGQMLKNRLRMLRDFAAHPEIAEQEVNAPLMISGSLRTGSTKLLSLLSASGDFNSLNFWQVYNFASRTGIPNEDPAERIAEVDEYLAYNEELSPEIRSIHLQGTYEPEEETLIAMQTMRSPSWFGYGNIPSYMAWVAEQDLIPTFEFVRDALKYLQWQGIADPAKRWVLKSPFNFGFEDMITSVFPDATFLTTHRPPAHSIASLFSLLEALIRCHANNPTVDAQMTMMGQVMTYERHVALRASNPDIALLDIHFKDAVGDVGKVVQRIYDAVGEDLSPASLAKIFAWDNDNPMHKHGRHSYSLSDYGLSEEQIVQHCPNYSAFYREAFGDD